MGKLTADELERQGGATVEMLSPGVRLLKWYTPWGKMLMLPGDPWSIEKYSRKGFTLRPPLHPEPAPVSTVGIYKEEGVVTVADEAETPGVVQLKMFD